MALKSCTSLEFQQAPYCFKYLNDILLTLIIGEEELKRMKHPSRLTVGARAFCKHAHRSSEGFWGSVKGTET
jgi:hypothetical protein